MAAIAAMSAAAIAYRKAVKKTRTSNGKEIPLWLKEFRDRMPELTVFDSETKAKAKENQFEVKKRELADSSDWYDQVAWFTYKHLTSKNWFEAFIMLNILLLGLATGLDLEYSEAGYKGTVAFVDFVGDFTVWVFTVECVLKLVAEAWRPERYFQDPANGAFNTFDFVIVVAGWTLASIGGGAIGALRMLRLVRLLTFVKGIKQLRVIVSGLLTGMKSVSYIVILLLLVIYMFAILACLLFGANDPARFGTVAIAMLSLFQVSTLASWTSIAYTSWFGCSKYGGAPYDDSNPSMVFTPYGAFEGYRCDADSTSQLTVLMFFWLYIILTAWVIMSLFIGVITMGMFESFQEMKAEIKVEKYHERLEKNNSSEESVLSKMLRAALIDEPNKKVVVKKSAHIAFENTCAWCKKQRDSTWLTTLVTITIITVGVIIGVETDQYSSCNRYSNRDNRPPNIIQRCEVTFVSSFMEVASQAIFSGEACIKILSHGYEPMRYLDDPWNCLDAFVVFTGFVELTPARVIFEIFPMVVLRLLRLLRVFRLAKALPRLRSIVEALMEGFSAVGWIVLLIVVFNYILGCMCMLFLKKNDPYHFGSISRAMIAMRGCDAYPAGYDFTDRRGKGLGDVISLRCDNPNALGWLGALLMLVIVILGSFVLPTVLIGIVAISFEEATQKAINVRAVMASMDGVMEQVHERLPGYFTDKKMAELKEIFNEIDADGELSIDINEMVPFYNMSFEIIFDCTCPEEQMEGMFHLIDGDCSSALGFPEFVLFIAVLKRIEAECDADPNLGKRMFVGLDSKFQRLKKGPDMEVETKESDSTLPAEKTLSFTPSVRKPETPPLPQPATLPPKKSDFASVHRVAAAELSLPAVQYGKRAQLRYDPQIHLTHVVHIATASIAECFLHPSKDPPSAGKTEAFRSPKLQKELTSRLFDVVASELMFRGAVARTPKTGPVFGPAPNPRDLDGLMNATVTLFAGARASKSDMDHLPPPLQPHVLPPLPPLTTPNQSSARSMSTNKTGKLEALLSPESAGQFLDGSVRAAGVGHSTGRLLNYVQNAANHDRDNSKDTSSVADLTSSSTAARRFKVGRSAATVATTEARHTSSFHDNDGHLSRTSKRAEILRQTQKTRGASEPRGTRPISTKQDSFEDRFQKERRLPQPRNRVLAPPRPPLSRSTGDVGGAYLRRNTGGSMKHDLLHGSRSGRFGQELGGKFDSPQIPRSHTPPSTRSPRRLTPPPRSPSNRASDFGKPSPSNSNTSNNSGSNSNTNSSTNFIARKNGSAVNINVSSKSSISHSRKTTNETSSFGNRDSKYELVPPVNGQLSRAAVERSTSAASGANRCTSAAAWEKILALLAADNQAACALEELFKRAPDGFLDLDELALSLSISGVPLKGPALRGFQADCDLNGNGTISLIQFLLAVQSRHSGAKANSYSKGNAHAATNTLLSGSHHW